ncbi:dihydrodipicolinate synthase family protein [Paracoccus liaowanqingii]|uniref:Dihydrodipicolinate synthase family protein n=1 Tax=Paracoccus liaowanqingii TaxID=2560053 RepID=A0A4Z1CG91_9RHOB|nr:dihydrodipicolinate synthase family protein [Paracoccus liaowanqingii]TGN60445.1 dihydrodipicolinate synthase family protein [Paracoccus liaowanqingii]
MRGLSAFPITPTDAEGRLLVPDLRRLILRLARAGVDSIGVLGSTGGYAYLDPGQRREVLETALDAAGRKVPVIAGVGALRSDISAALARHAADAGAAGLLLAPMSYTPLTEDEVFAHFQTVADASDLPICIYNNPSTTHFTFSPALLARLATLPTVTAVKMPLPADDDIAGQIARLRADLPQGFIIGYSGDWGCPDALLNRADGWFSVAAGLWPDHTLTLSCAAGSGDRAQTDRVQARFRPMWDLFQAHGSLRVVHACARLMELTDAQPPRPILPLPEALTPSLRASMQALDG